MAKTNIQKLYLLLWKNFTIHRRHKFRLVVEAIVPILLFLLLMVLRMQGLRYYMPECHFDQKALPSTGLWPFFQSTLCTFNNTCHQSESNLVLTESAHTNLKFVNNLIDDIENVGKTYMTESKLNNINNMFADMEAFSKLLWKLTNPYVKVSGTINIADLFPDAKGMADLIENSSIKFPRNASVTLLNGKIVLSGIQGIFDLQRVTLYAHLCNRDGISNLILVENRPKWRILKYNLCTISASDAKDLFYLLLSNLSWKNLYNQLSNVTEINVGMRPPKFESYLEAYSMIQDVTNQMGELPSFYYIREKMKELKGSNNLTEIAAFSIQMFQTFLCGRNSSSLFDPDNQGLERRFEEIKEQMKESLKVKKNNISGYSYDNSTNSRCNEVFEFLENNADTQIVWQMFKPFVRGKILYAPATKATFKIINKVNETLQPLANLRDFLSELAAKISPMSALDSEDESSQSSIMNNLNDFIETMENYIGDDINIIGFSTQDLYDYFISPNLETLLNFVISLSNVIEDIKTHLECFELDRFVGFSNEKELVLHGVEMMKEKTFLAGVIFTNVPEDENNEELPTYIKYKIRMDAKQVESSKRIFDFFPKAGPRRRPTFDLKYLTFGFAFLQDIIEHAIIKIQTDSDEDTGVYVQQFPYPCYILDQFLFLICINFAFFMTVAWLYTCSMITKEIVQEKQRRLKEVMKMMGLDNGILWLAWFIESMLIMTFSSVILAIIFVFGGILPRSDSIIIFIYIISYCIATVSISFFLSTLFSKANIAAVAGGTLFFLSYLPSSFLNRFFMDMPYWYKFASSLLPSCAFGMGSIYISNLEENGDGAQWSNLGVSPIPGDYFSLGHCIGMCLLDSVIFMLLALYIEAVFPGQFGIAQPWYYFLTKSYWFGSIKSTHENVNGSEINFLSQLIEDDFEDEPTDLNVGVSIQRLSKIYKANNKKAVDNLSLNFYENQITSFLGHNGAGKTTTISMLIGLYPPTSGTALVNGYSITEEIDGVRHSLGVCPQYNVLFDSLTVEEHLWFYGCLKGGSDESVKEEMDQLLSDLGLEDKRNELSCKLSGGMQRKLSVGIAFTAGSKTVILDEPTAGVDPCARRSIWELLLNYKNGRTIILTTHHMDEADLLGDRIAVIANGKLRCCGSSLFLKSRYGKGYYLTMVKSDKHSKVNGLYDMSDEKNNLLDYSNNEDAVPRMKRFIKNYVKEGELLENVGADMTFLVPKKNQADGSLLKLLEALEKQQKYLPISSYGISESSFEEIFLRVTEDSKKDIMPDMKDTRSNAAKILFACGNLISIMLSCFGQKKPKRPDVMEFIDSHLSPPPSPSKQVIGNHLYWQQFMALIIRRFHHTKRNYKELFCEIALPVFFVCISMCLSEFTASFSEEPPIELHPWHFKQPQYVFFENLDSSSQISKTQIESLVNVGMGNRCVRNNPIEGFECSSTSEVNFQALRQQYNVTEANNIIDCSCSLGSIKCPLGAGGPTPPSVAIATNEFLYNVSGRNISDWVLKTTKKYYKERFGGFSFGIKNPVVENLDYIVANLSRRLIDPWSKNLNLTLVYEFINNLNKEIHKIRPSNNAKVWFNNHAWISPVTFINSLNNIILRSKLTSGQDPKDYGISVTNHPMKYAPDQVQDIIDDHGDLGFIRSICIIFALSFVPASFIIFIIEDKSSGSKHLQYVSGLKPLLYWTSSLIWDVFKGAFVVLLCLLIFLAFDEQSYVSENHFSGFATILFLFCWAGIPLMYIASFLFDSASAAFITLSSVNLFVGVLTTISIYILRMLDNEALENLASVLDKIYLIFPHYCLGRGLMDLYSSHLVAFAFSDYGINLHKNPFSWNFLGLNMFLLGLEGIIFFIIVIFIDYALIRSKRFSFPSNEAPKVDKQDEYDEDVLQEIYKARLTKAVDTTLLIKDLTKVYKGQNTPAVNKLCLSVGSGQCFGLLGVNGAGKTSTFKMLTGDTQVTSGDAFIGGFSIKTHMEDACEVIGYCPQFDALDPLLTALEHLEFYARISGIPEKSVKSTAYWGIKKLGLTRYAHNTSGTYSGGNKRKLSTAIALIGYPAVIFLDEPTTGMDPQSKRFLWNCILDIVKDGHCVILTSHSMEECEALCTRLAIMARGQFQCIGSIQHLKNKFGAGYTVTLKIMPGVEDFPNIMNDTFNSHAELREEHLNQLQYHINSSLQLSFIFRKLEEFKNRSLIETYSVTQTTLEQVFINFAKEPEPPTSLKVEKSSPIKKPIKFVEEKPEPLNLVLKNGNAVYELNRETVV